MRDDKTTVTPAGPVAEDADLLEDRRPAVASCWPVHEEDEIASVTEVLRSGRVNALQHGDRCRAFERRFADHCGMPHGVAVANGTLALELALHALQIGPGDDVVVTARSFFASAACVVNRGARPVFADVDLDSQNVTAASVAAALTPRTRAVLAVHLAGWPCAMDELTELCQARGLLLIEDCAQAHGATWRGRPVGGFGDAAAFSFCTDKIMSTGGEGGLLLLRDPDSWARAWSYKDHGKNHAKVTEASPAPGFRWVHDGIGSNWRLTEMQAAIGLCQFAKLPLWSSRRRDNAARLSDALRDLPGLRRTLPPPEAGHAYYKYYAFLRPDELRAGWTRERVIAEVTSLGVPCFSGTCPEIYREAAFTKANLAPPTPLPAARQLGETSLMFLVDHTLAAADMATTAKAVARIMTLAAK